MMVTVVSIGPVTLALSNTLPGGKAAKHFFFTSTPNPCKNLNSYFQEPWKEMKLPDCPNFTDLRTLIASHVSIPFLNTFFVLLWWYASISPPLFLFYFQAKYTHGDEDRMKVAKFMCHDMRNADKFYAMNLTEKQALEHRRLFE